MTEAVLTDIQCSLCAARIPPVPNWEETAWRGMAIRYNGFWSAAGQLAICLSCDRGNRVCPKTGGDLVMLRESHLPWVQPPEMTEAALPEMSAPVQQLLDQLWTADNAAAVGRIVDATDPVLLMETARELDFTRLPTNPDIVRGFEHKGKDERFMRMLDVGLHLLKVRPAAEEATKWWDELLEACRARVYRARDSRAPLDDTRDPQYLVGSVRQLLVQAGNALLRAKRPREAELCFRTVIVANPELSEVQYAHAVASNNVVATPGSTRLDRVLALRAFNSFLRSSSARQDARRLATVDFLRRQIMGMKDHPKP
ncbi:MAG: hypothetical protein AB7K09_22465 [Planctomycetota bacterium]